MNIHLHTLLKPIGNEGTGAPVVTSLINRTVRPLTSTSKPKQRKQNITSTAPNIVLKHI